ncbi:YjbE family integral membrane protein [Pullulanibacillus pueri]|uniref:Membrane protein n=1 Tax=Pullulanibacillus pueri TaxID=1437324 RepID=A0A8J2ZWP3_9BACL|nr:TerC family protein [Pullulanibacillus pueri]MBM7680590.1 YjbE family integral membrane protein [Pullulanibacillus pueri]GGH84004.1 membrane protein [Pullulanibacillus pueri]
MEISLDTLIAIVNIIVIDIILGGDNAVVIALACRNLPERRRNKAIILGTGLAVILRILLTAIMLSLLQIPYLLFAGGIFLIYIAFKLIADKEDDINIKSGTTLFGAVRTIVIADLIMGLDNILGIAGASHGNLILVMIGLCVSVPIIIWGSKVILVAMDHLPALIYLGGGVLGYTAAEMIIHEPSIHDLLKPFPQAKAVLTVSIIIIILLLGWIKNNSIKSTR